MSGSGDNTNQQPDPTALNRVAIRVPPFWKPDPALWFFKIEAQFRYSAITADQTKYDAVVASIDAEILSQVFDVVRSPPAEGKYEMLKKRLIDAFADTENQQIRKLLTEQELGDLRPSQLLTKMRTLAGTKVNDDFLKTLWLQRLPVNSQTILSASGDKLDNLSAMADRIWETNPISINKISTSFETSELEKLRQQISLLTTQVSELSKRNSRPTFRSRSKSKSRNSSPYAVQGVCFYHKRFGAKAQKCSSPCDFKNATRSSN